MMTIYNMSCVIVVVIYPFLLIFTLSFVDFTTCHELVVTCHLLLSLSWCRMEWRQTTIPTKFFCDQPFWQMQLCPWVLSNHHYNSAGSFVSGLRRQLFNHCACCTEAPTVIKLIFFNLVF